MKKQPLFEEFNPVSAIQWKEKIISDLKGADYEKKLITPLDEGFEVQPFYQKEHLDSLRFLQSPPGRFPYVRGRNTSGNRWRINQIFPVEELQKTNREVQKAIENGVDSLTFVFNEKTGKNKNSLPSLLQQLDGKDVEVHFRGVQPNNLSDALKKKILPHKLKGSFENDPLAYFTLHGCFKEKEPFVQLAEKFKAAAYLSDVYSVSVDGTIFHNAGGTIVSEMAFALSMGSYYMQFLTDKGFAADDIAGKILFRLATGSDYFMEMAKFRAFRYLWAQILKAFGVSEDKAGTCIHAENAYRNKTVYDPYVNMLRTTTETMSAILGGADVITVLPFDTAFEKPVDMAVRVARNQQLILKEESYFDKVADPAAGSYYIEDLTANLIEKSWKLFLKTDDLGGYPEAFKKGFVQDMIETEARKKEADLMNRKVSILGINQFPNIVEHIDETLDLSVFNTEPVTKDTAIKPLHPYRAAAPFEKLRYTTDRYAKTHRRPRVWLLTLGDVAMRRARAQFAENFFGCAGYEIIDHAGFASAEEGIASAREEKPEIVVLCSDDTTYENTALKVFEALKEETIVVLAGYPKPLVQALEKAGMKHFIHVRSNMLEELQAFNKILGVE